MLTRAFAPSGWREREGISTSKALVFVISVIMGRRLCDIKYLVVCACVCCVRIQGTVERKQGRTVETGQDRTGQ